MLDGIWIRLPGAQSCLAHVGIALVVLGCGDSGPTGNAAPPDDPGPDTPPPAEARWQKFDLDSLRAVREENGETLHWFLDEPFIRMGVYALDEGQEDDQGQHASDEVYQVLSGSGELFAGQRRMGLTEGALVWVKAGQTHRIVAESRIEAVVYTSKSATGAGALTTREYALADIRANADGTRNVWVPFLQVPSSILGAYLLPTAIGGDGTLTHSWDEVNLVLSGSSRFHMGSDVVEIGPGSIVYVQSGVGHRFDQLEADLEVLIFWDQR